MLVEYTVFEKSIQPLQWEPCNGVWQSGVKYFPFILVLAITLSCSRNDGIEEKIDSATEFVENNYEEFESIIEMAKASYEGKTIRFQISQNHQVKLNNDMEKTPNPENYKSYQNKAFENLAIKLRVSSITVFDDHITVISGFEGFNPIDLENGFAIHLYYGSPTDTYPVCESRMYTEPFGGCIVSIRGNWYAQFTWTKVQ